MTIHALKNALFVTTVLSLLSACGGGSDGGSDGGSESTDTVSPMITLNGAQTVQVELGQTYVDGGAIAADDTDGNISQLIVISNPVNTAILGSYTVTYNVSDSAGNTANEVSRTVEVVDTQAPVITLIGADAVTTTVGDPYLDSGATAMDNADGDISAQILSTPSTLDTSNLGTFEIRFNVNDSSGNTASEVVRTVDVIDDISPIITLLGDNPVYIEKGQNYSDSGASAFDNYDGTVNVSSSGTVNVNTSGVYEITYEARDSANNLASINRTVVVGGLSLSLNARYDVDEKVFEINTAPTVTHSQGGVIKYQIVGGDDEALFNIDENSGTLKFKQVTNYEAPTSSESSNAYQIAIRASEYSDSDVVSLSETVSTTIHVQDKMNALPLVAIRMEFNDYQMESDATTWHNKLFGIQEGQVNHYYNEVSQQDFQLIPAVESQLIENDGIITVHFNENHPGDENNAMLPRFIEALSQADPYIDFSQYDTDNNRALSMDELQILFIVAGGDRSSGLDPGIWPHAWTLFGSNAEAPTLDGVLLLDTQSNGWYSAIGASQFDHGNDATIGVIVHELGHSAFDLPDLYDTTEQSNGIGNWGLMGSGSWGYKRSNGVIEGFGETPVHMTAWSKIQSGFIEAYEITADQLLLNISGTGTDQYFPYRLSTDNSEEYFLIENRSGNGYDLGLLPVENSFARRYTGGLSILHIDDSQEDNDVVGDKLVDIEEANGAGLDTASHDGVIENLFFNSNQNSFTPSTTPNSNLKSGESSHISITNISAPDDSMTADIEVAN